MTQSTAAAALCALHAGREAGGDRGEMTLIWGGGEEWTGAELNNQPTEKRKDEDRCGHIGGQLLRNITRVNQPVGGGG